MTRRTFLASSGLAASGLAFRAASASERLPIHKAVLFSMLPAELTIRYHNRALAELACELRAVERRDEKVVALRNDDPLQLFRTFIAAVFLSRGVSE